VVVAVVDEEVSQAVLFSLLVSALRLGAKKDVIIVFQYLIPSFLNFANDNVASEVSIWKLELRKLSYVCVMRLFVLFWAAGGREESCDLIFHFVKNRLLCMTYYDVICSCSCDKNNEQQGTRNSFYDWYTYYTYVLFILKCHN